MNVALGSFLVFYDHKFWLQWTEKNLLQTQPEKHCIWTEHSPFRNGCIVQPPLYKPWVRRRKMLFETFLSSLHLQTILNTF